MPSIEIIRVYPDDAQSIIDLRARSLANMGYPREYIQQVADIHNPEHIELQSLHLKRHEESDRNIGAYVVGLGFAGYVDMCADNNYIAGDKKVFDDPFGEMSVRALSIANGGFWNINSLLINQENKELFSDVANAIFEKAFRMAGSRPTCLSIDQNNNPVMLDYLLENQYKPYLVTGRSNDVTEHLYVRPAYVRENRPFSRLLATTGLATLATDC